MEPLRPATPREQNLPAKISEYQPPAAPIRDYKQNPDIPAAKKSTGKAFVHLIELAVVLFLVFFFIHQLGSAPSQTYTCNTTTTDTTWSTHCGYEPTGN